MREKRSFRNTHIGEHELSAATQMMSYGYDPSLSEGAIKPPIFLTSTFVFRSAEEGARHFDVASGRLPVPDGEGAGGLVYSRINHPNTEIVEDRLALLDGAEGALLTASGMAAITATLLTLTRPGDTIVHYCPLYGGTEALIGTVLTEWGIQPEPVADGHSEEALLAALDRAFATGPVAVVYFETPANPTTATVDIAMVRRVVDAWSERTGCRPRIVCDNTLLGPIFQNPLVHGADLSVYSLTKYVGGHSDLIAGGITGSKALLSQIRRTRCAFGLQLDPHSSWMLARSLETLALRMRHAAETGRVVATWLQRNPHVPCRVLHPELDADAAVRALFERQCSGPGSTFSFVVEDDRALAFRILNELKLFKLAVSLGGTESLVCHPASTTHSGVAKDVRDALGVTEGLIRLSVGLEDAADLIADLDHAMRRAASGLKVAV